MQRLLVVGYGDIARRAQLERRFEVTRRSRGSGFDLDRPESLTFEGADAVLHCAPPANEGDADSRTANLLAALEKGRILPSRVVYISTSGVYGDCGGARVDESRPVAPQTARARRRVDAERRLFEWCTQHSASLVVLRAPGIYARERLPLETDAPAGVYNASDDSELRMADWMDLVAERHGLPRPPRLPRAAVKEQVPAEVYSFMCESRRLDNSRLKRVLGVKLIYPTVQQGVRHEHAVGID